MKINISLCLALTVSLAVMGTGRNCVQAQQPIVDPPLAQAADPGAAGPYQFWPRFARPRHVLLVKSPASKEMAVLLQCLAGLAAYSCQAGKTDDMIWLPLDTPAYRRWFDMMVQQTGAEVEGPYEIWDLVDRFKAAGLVKGYRLYRYDDSAREMYSSGDLDASVNVATSLCALTGALPVTEELAVTAQQHELPELGDARNMSEEQCLAQYGEFFNPRILASVDPKASEIRQECVANHAFVLSQPGPLYEKALSLLQPDSPILGWPSGDEKEVTLPSSLWGHFQTATNWCQNLPLLSTEVPGVSYPAKKLQSPHPFSLWDLTWEDNVHYATFLMSDGDNVQWMMGSFFGDDKRQWWDSNYRGQVPIGWSLCYPDLAQVSPYTLDYLFQSATPRDDFVLFGGGYYYPDVFGSKSPEANLLKLHAARINQYMELGHLHTLLVNMQQWNSPDALKAYATYIEEMPGLQGIYAIQYAPYTAGGGIIQWLPDGKGGETPVVTVQQAIWNHADFQGAGGPIKVAEQLNGLSHQGAPDNQNYYSTVIIHAWSWFKEPAAGMEAGSEEVDQAQGGQPGTSGGLAAEKWCLDRVEPYVRVLTPTQLIGMIRLRMRPQQTLQSGLEDLRVQLRLLEKQQIADLPANLQAAQQAHMTLETAQAALLKADFKNCFEQGKVAHQLIEKIKP